MSLSDADAYDRFMGRYSRPLAVPFADFAELPLDGLALRASSAVSAPGPHPTSRTRPSSGSPAKSAKGTASGLE